MKCKTCGHDMAPDELTYYEVYSEDFGCPDCDETPPNKKLICPTCQKKRIARLKELAGWPNQVIMRENNWLYTVSTIDRRRIPGGPLNMAFFFFEGVTGEFFETAVTLPFSEDFIIVEVYKSGQEAVEGHYWWKATWPTIVLNPLNLAAFKKAQGIELSWFNRVCLWIGSKLGHVSPYLPNIHHGVKIHHDVKMESIPDYGDIMTIDQFYENCKCGGFIDYDGFGYYATDKEMSNIVVRPHEYKQLDWKWTHIVWFNR